MQHTLAVEVLKNTKKLVMAKALIKHFVKKKVKRKGIHSKNLSRLKTSKQYKKPYNSQGKK